MDAGDNRPDPGDLGDGRAEGESLQAMREAHIKRVLHMAGGDLQVAAEMLEISLPELRRWMTKLGIE